MKVGRAPATGVDGRLARLELIADDLDRRIDETKVELGERITTVGDDIRRETAALRSRRDERDAADRTHAESTAGLQWAGWVLFVFGVVLQTLGNIV